MEIPLNKYNSSKADICFGFNIGKNKDNLGGMLGKCGIAVKHLWKSKKQTNKKLKTIKKNVKTICCENIGENKTLEENSAIFLKKLILNLCQRALRSKMTW